MKLSLKKDVLTELTSEELGALVGASGVSCATLLCISNPCSDFRECTPPSLDGCFTGTTGTN